MDMFETAMFWYVILNIVSDCPFIVGNLDVLCNKASGLGVGLDSSSVLAI